MLTDCQKGRWPGARIKHRVKNNWLKMYDKFGWVLRIETVINDPREFRVRRLRTREGRPEMVWCPMNKGVINLYRYREVALASNRRYLDALAVVDDPAPAYRQVEELTEPVVVSGRSHAGFNPASPADVRLFQAVLAGENLLRGFRNADIRAALYGIDRGCRGTPSSEPRGRPDAEAVARAGPDREGAAQPSVARQQERPSGAWCGRALVSLRNPGSDRDCGVIRPKDARTRRDPTE